MMQKIIFVVAVMILIYINLNLLAGDSSIYKLLQLRQQLEGIIEINTRLADRNKILAMQVIKLQSDDEIIEKIARENLGMIHKDELLFITVKK
jgi:cell division protein FtsB